MASGWVTGIGKTYLCWYDLDSTMLIGKDTSTPQLVKPVESIGTKVSSGVNDEGDQYTGGLVDRMTGYDAAGYAAIAAALNANFAAFLACSVHSDPNFQYSAYFMAFRYCYSALASVNTQAAAAAAARVKQGVGDTLRTDWNAYDAFFNQKQDTKATHLADTMNDTYLKTSGEKQGISSYAQVCDLLVNWHIQTVVLPSITVEESPFDPYDETQVDLSGIVNAR